MFIAYFKTKLLYLWGNLLLKFMFPFTDRVIEGPADEALLLHAHARAPSGRH